MVWYSIVFILLLFDIRHWMLDVGCWMVDIGYWILDIGYWILDLIIQNIYSILHFY